MKLEILTRGPRDRPLVRLYAFTPTEAQRFQTDLAALASGRVDSVAVHDLPFIEAIDASRLFLRVKSWDQSLVRGTLPGEFECGFTRETWHHAAGLVEPFLESASGFQWLAGAPGEASLLLSVDGQW